MSALLSPDPPVNVTPEHTTAINSQCWTGSKGDITMCFVKWETYCISWGIRSTVRRPWCLYIL